MQHNLLLLMTLAAAHVPPPVFLRKTAAENLSRGKKKKRNKRKKREATRRSEFDKGLDMPSPLSSLPWADPRTTMPLPEHLRGVDFTAHGSEPPPRCDGPIPPLKATAPTSRVGCIPMGHMFRRRASTGSATAKRAVTEPSEIDTAQKEPKADLETATPTPSSPVWSPASWTKVFNRRRSSSSSVTEAPSSSSSEGTPETDPAPFSPQLNSDATSSLGEGRHTSVRSPTRLNSPAHDTNAHSTRGRHRRVSSISIAPSSGFESTSTGSHSSHTVPSPPIHNDAESEGNGPSAGTHGRRWWRPRVPSLVRGMNFKFGKPAPSVPIEVVPSDSTEDSNAHQPPSCFHLPCFRPAMNNLFGRLRRWRNAAHACDDHEVRESDYEPEVAELVPRPDMFRFHPYFKDHSDSTAPTASRRSTPLDSRLRLLSVLSEEERQRLFEEDQDRELWLHQYELANPKDRRPLGGGGFAKVWKCRHIVTKEIVAVKVFDIKRLEEEKGFNRAEVYTELEFSLSMDHPHVVKCIDATATETHAFLVMECVTGAKTLGNLYLRPGRVAMWVIAQLIKALVDLDEKGILHRDISLDNILVKPNGDIVLIDFGFAMWKTDIKATDRTFFGTMPFISPELCSKRINARHKFYRYKPRMVTAESFVTYPLAVLTYLLLSGERYFAVERPGDYDDQPQNRFTDYMCERIVTVDHGGVTYGLISLQQRMAQPYADFITNVVRKRQRPTIQEVATFFEERGCEGFDDAEKLEREAKRRLCATAWAFDRKPTPEELSYHEPEIIYDDY